MERAINGSEPGVDDQVQNVGDASQSEDDLATLLHELCGGKSAGGNGVGGVVGDDGCHLLG